MEGETREVWIGKCKNGVCIMLWTGPTRYSFAHRPSEDARTTTFAPIPHRMGTNAKRPIDFFCPGCNYCKVIK